MSQGISTIWLRNPSLTLPPGMSTFWLRTPHSPPPLGISTIWLMSQREVCNDYISLVGYEWNLNVVCFTFTHVGKRDPKRTSHSQFHFCFEIVYYRSGYVHIFLSLIGFKLFKKILEWTFKNLIHVLEQIVRCLVCYKVVVLVVMACINTVYGTFWSSINCLICQSYIRVMVLFFFILGEQFFTRVIQS